MPHALIVDDDEHNLTSLAELVSREGFSISTAHTLTEARQQLALQRPDIILLDIVLPDGSGLDLFRDLDDPRATEVVLVTGYATLETSIEALRLGAADYLTKPVNIKQLKRVLGCVARPVDLKRQIGKLRAELRHLGRFGPLLGGSEAMQAVYDQVARVAPTPATVFITGESGTGKELVAQTVHELSRRANQPFVAVNCGAISPHLIESELFGHEKGSFTGATRQHRGYFERADGGTLFLDEILEMPIELQPKLLRVLETGTVVRVGSERQLEVDVRLISATNRAPEEAVSEGKLREDLLYRLRVFPLHLPALRERMDDITQLANHFLEDLNQSESTSKIFTEEALAQLRAYHWPGNVRELRNAVHRAFIMADEAIDIDALPGEVKSTQAGPLHSAIIRVGMTVAETERRLIFASLERCGGRKTEAARMLGISLKTLYNRLRAYDAKSDEEESAEQDLQKTEHTPSMGREPGK